MMAGRGHGSNSCGCERPSQSSLHDKVFVVILVAVLNYSAPASFKGQRIQGGTSSRGRNNRSETVDRRKPLETFSSAIAASARVAARLCSPSQHTEWYRSRRSDSDGRSVESRRMRRQPRRRKHGNPCDNAISSFAASQRRLPDTTRMNKSGNRVATNGRHRYGDLFHQTARGYRRTVRMLLAMAFFLNEVERANAQYKADTLLYEERMTEAEADLTASLQGGEYVEDIFYPNNQYEDTDTYVYAFPDSSDYAIGIIVDPCKGNSYDCCHRFFGSPEYPMMVEPDDSSYRVVDKYLYTDDTEILANTAIVDKDGNIVANANSRFADDEIVIDDNCTANGIPESSCVGFRQKMQRSGNVARCMDNNQTVNAHASCQDLTGGTSELCLAVAYSQTAISVTCGGEYAEDDHCGTFLELHMAYDNSYVGTEEVLSEVRLRTDNVTGYTTTTMPTIWMNDKSRVLCSFEHVSLLVGTMVLISQDAPVCCCPRAFSQKDLLGSFICPVHDSLGGPFAAPLDTIAKQLAHEEDMKTYPFCPALDEHEDQIMVSEYSNVWDRYYTREAETVAVDNSTSSYTSGDLSGGYDGICEYFPECATSNSGGTCEGDDRAYTFAGRVGKVTFAPDDPEDEQYAVTFNDGRTSYLFNQEHIQVEQDKNYEIWWVQRTLYNFRVQAIKPLTVTSPTCTFDRTNEQYYPYAMLDDEGNIID